MLRGGKKTQEKQ